MCSPSATGAGASRRIGRRTGQLEFEVTRAIFQLVTAALVNVLPPRPEGPAAVVEVINRALVEIHRTCEAFDPASGLAELREGLEQFAASTGTYVPLLDGAGPLDDGSLRPERIGKNARVLAGGDAERWLAAQLFDYAGFALFHAGSLLSRDEETALKERVTEMLKPLRQQLDGNTPSDWMKAPSGAPHEATKDLL